MPDYEKFEMLDDQNACALLIDHQAGLMLFCGDIDPVHLRNNCIALAKVLKLHNIPVVMSAAAFGPSGPLGPFLPEILELFPDVQPIYRTKINSWHDPRIKSAIQATGRKKVIAAGITADFCVGIPAKSMAAEGYDVRLVMDASGNYSDQVLTASTANLTQHGVKVTNWLSVACELQQDWSIENTAKGLLDIYSQHLPEWGMLQITQDTWKTLPANGTTNGAANGGSTTTAGANK